MCNAELVKNHQREGGEKPPRTRHRNEIAFVALQTQDLTDSL